MLKCYLKEKVMEAASHQEDSDKLVMQEPTQFGISNQKSYSETETKLYISPLY
jgi:hypothetical protein